MRLDSRLFFSVTLMPEQSIIDDRHEGGIKIYAAILGKRPTIDPSQRKLFHTTSRRVRTVDPNSEPTLRARIENWAGNMLDSIDQARSRVAATRVKEKLIVQPKRVKPVILVGTSIRKVKRSKEAA